ncbi:TlpA family protein disulfide reductase [Sphingobacterium faecale]|uniref:TlpA family protein disulfide reductase n=1 Tax=Sphingobacterium faecale TaxID=2803775 RepID=A0ABS1QYZ5_9SPHI|nr:TlpA disulfide reductase family protein [Sphingobacterium faecale]MBL1407534.1 TlpA family protein disulfide reductase [Sphingobacterium faecale]
MIIDEKQYIDSIKALKIGDTIPQVLWDVKLGVVGHPAGAKQLALRDYKNSELIILDFWATYCSSCIAAFPSLSKLEKDFGKELKILSISHQDAASIQKFIDRSEYLKENNLDKSFYSVVNDTILAKYFGRSTIPFNVVIDKKGKVRALTTPDELTADRLAMMIADNTAKPILPRKSTIDGPLLRSITGEAKDIYYSAILPYDPTLPVAVKKKVDSLRQIKHFVLPNWGLKRLFAYLIHHQSPRKENVTFTPSRCIIEADPQSEEFLSVFDTNGKYSRVTYESVSPMLVSDSTIFAKMKIDLDILTGMKASYQKRKIPCLIVTVSNQKLLPINKSGLGYPTLVRNGRSDGDGTGDGRFEQRVQLNNNQTKNFMSNYSMKDMLYAFNQSMGANLPFMIDETNFKGKLDLKLPHKVDDLQSLQASFAEQGLRLSLEQRELEVFVLSSNKFKINNATLTLTSNGYVYSKRKEVLK